MQITRAVTKANSCCFGTSGDLSLPLSTFISVHTDLRGDMLRLRKLPENFGKSTQTSTLFCFLCKAVFCHVTTACIFKGNQLHYCRNRVWVGHELLQGEELVEGFFRKRQVGKYH